MFKNLLTPQNLKFLLISLALAVLAAVLWGGIGYRIGYNVAQAKGDADIAQLQKEVAKAHANASEAARLQLLNEVEKGNRLARDLAEAKAQHAEEKQTLLRRIADVTTLYIPVGGQTPEPLPATVFTTGFLREYNTAIGLPSADAGTIASGAGDPPSTPASFDRWLLASGLSQADILAHIADYGERCRNLEAQLNRLIDYEEATSGHH